MFTYLAWGFIIKKCNNYQSVIFFYYLNELHAFQVVYLKQKRGNSKGSITKFSQSSDASSNISLLNDSTEGKGDLSATNTGDAEDDEDMGMMILMHLRDCLVFKIYCRIWFLGSTKIVTATFLHQPKLSQKSYFSRQLKNDVKSS